MSAFFNSFNIGIADGICQNLFGFSPIMSNMFRCCGYSPMPMFNAFQSVWNFPINYSISSYSFTPMFTQTFVQNNTYFPEFNTSFNFESNSGYNSGGIFSNLSSPIMDFQSYDIFTPSTITTSKAPLKASNSSTKTSVTTASSTKGSGINRRVDNKCNLTADQLNKSLSGVLQGKGQKFLDAEAKYGVNAAFMVAICNLESGHGTSTAAKERNNVAGILPHGAKKFGSVDECIDYLGNLLANGKYYFKQGKKTIADIGPTYCSANWASSVSNCMDDVLRKA